MSTRRIPRSSAGDPFVVAARVRLERLEDRYNHDGSISDDERQGLRDRIVKLRRKFKEAR